MYIHIFLVKVSSIKRSKNCVKFLLLQKSTFFLTALVSKERT